MYKIGILTNICLKWWAVMQKATVLSFLLSKLESKSTLPLTHSIDTST